MIIGNIKDAQRYYSVCDNLKEAFEFLKGLSADSTEGIVTDGYRVSVSSPTAKRTDTDANGAQRVAEAHRDYLDIHYVIKGSEGIGYADVSRLTPVTEYNKEKDFVLLSGNVTKFILHEGDFCIVFPEDAHVPAMTGDTVDFKKAVVKIKV